MLVTSAATTELVLRPAAEFHGRMGANDFVPFLCQLLPHPCRQHLLLCTCACTALVKILYILCASIAFGVGVVIWRSGTCLGITIVTITRSVLLRCHSPAGVHSRSNQHLAPSGTP